MKPERFKFISKTASQAIHTIAVLIGIAIALLHIHLILIADELRRAIDPLDLFRVVSFSFAAFTGAHIFFTSLNCFTLQTANLMYRAFKVNVKVTKGLITNLIKIERRIVGLWQDVEECNNIWSTFLALFQFLATAVLIRFLVPKARAYLRWHPAWSLEH